MRTTQRVLFAFAWVAAMLVMATASAQQKGRGRGFGGGAGSSLVSVAANEAVQKELGISGDVASKLNALRDDYRAAQQKEYSAAGIDFQGFQNLSADERQKLTTKMNEVSAKLNNEFTPKLKDAISADQFKRLKQIHIQAQGADALTNADVASELKLNDEQKKKLADLQAEYRRKQGELFSGGGGGAEGFAKLRELNTERTAKATELLTAEQKTKFTALKGDPFDVSQLGFGGGRGKGKN